MRQPGRRAEEGGRAGIHDGQEDEEDQRHQQDGGDGEGAAAAAVLVQAGHGRQQPWRGTERRRR